MNTDLAANTDTEETTMLRIGVVGSSFTLPQAENVKDLDLDVMEKLATVTGLFTAAIGEVRYVHPKAQSILVVRESDNDGVVGVVRALAAKRRWSVCSITRPDSLETATRNPFSTVEHLVTRNPNRAFLRLCHIVIRIGGDQEVRKLTNAFKVVRTKGFVYEFNI